MQPPSSTPTNPRLCLTGQCIATTMADTRATRPLQDPWGCKGRLRTGAAQGTKAAATTALRGRITAIPTSAAITTTRTPTVRTLEQGASTIRIPTIRPLEPAATTTPIRIMPTLIPAATATRIQMREMLHPVLRRSPSRVRRRSNTANNSHIPIQKRSSTKVQSPGFMQPGPRSAVGLVVSGLSDLHAGYLHFQTAELRMIVFADAVNNIDQAAGLERQFSSASRQVPTHRSNRATGSRMHCGLGSFLCQFQPNVPLFHDARRSQQPCSTRHKHRLGISVPQRFQLAQPAREHRRNTVQRQLGVNAQLALRFSCREMLVCV